MMILIPFSLSFHILVEFHIFFSAHEYILKQHSHFFLSLALAFFFYAILLVLMLTLLLLFVMLLLSVFANFHSPFFISHIPLLIQIIVFIARVLFVSFFRFSSFSCSMHRLNLHIFTPVFFMCAVFLLPKQYKIVDGNTAQWPTGDWTSVCSFS